MVLVVLALAHILAVTPAPADAGSPPGAAREAVPEPVPDSVPEPSECIDGGAAATAVTASDLDEEEAAPEAEDTVQDAPEEDMESEALSSAGDVADGGLNYSRDVSDTDLERLWKNDLPTLGSISVGFAEAGRLINGAAMPKGDAWTIVVQEAAYGTQEMIDALTAAASDVRKQFPQAPPLRINHIGKKDGGYLRPHQSHQSGRDADLGFFYRDEADRYAPKGKREALIDAEKNWALVKSLLTNADVQFILVDRRVQKVLYDWALAHGESQELLDSLFRAGANSIIHHARRHRDHFHVRVFAPRSQELGRRIQPILAQQPEQNIVIHRVRRGDNLGKIASRYGSTVRMIQNANHLANTFLRVGRTLNVPLRGPCTHCPLPPPCVVPPRRFPPPNATVLLEAPATDGGVATP